MLLFLNVAVWYIRRHGWVWLWKLVLEFAQGIVYSKLCYFTCYFHVTSPLLDFYLLVQFTCTIFFSSLRCFKTCSLNCIRDLLLFLSSEISFRQHSTVLSSGVNVSNFFLFTMLTLCSQLGLNCLRRSREGNHFHSHKWVLLHRPHHRTDDFRMCVCVVV